MWPSIHHHSTNTFICNKRQWLFFTPAGGRWTSSSALLLHHKHSPGSVHTFTKQTVQKTNEHSIKINVRDQMAWKRSLQRTKDKSTIINALSYNERMWVCVCFDTLGFTDDKWLFWKASSPWKSLTWWREWNKAGRKRSCAPGHAPCLWWWAVDTVMYRWAAPIIPQQKRDVTSAWLYKRLVRWQLRETHEQTSNTSNRATKTKLLRKTAGDLSQINEINYQYNINIITEQKH